MCWVITTVWVPGDNKGPPVAKCVKINNNLLRFFQDAGVSIKGRISLTDKLRPGQSTLNAGQSAKYRLKIYSWDLHSHTRLMTERRVHLFIQYVCWYDCRFIGIAPEHTVQDTLLYMCIKVVVKPSVCCPSKAQLSPSQSSDVHGSLGCPGSLFPHWLRHNSGSHWLPLLSITDIEPMRSGQDQTTALCLVD